MDSSQQLTTNVGMLIYLYRCPAVFVVCADCILAIRFCAFPTPHPSSSYPFLRISMRCELPLLLSEASTQLESSESYQKCPSQYQLPVCSSHSIACFTTRLNSKSKPALSLVALLSRARLSLSVVCQRLSLSLSRSCVRRSLSFFSHHSITLAWFRPRARSISILRS